MNLLFIIQNGHTAKEGAKRIGEVDPYGIGLAVIGITVVFLSLLMLYIVFFNLTKLVRKLNKKPGQAVQKPATKTQEEISGEVSSAIALALHIYFKEIHDEEARIMTIQRTSKTYSPWSSKIYGLRQYPR